MFRLSQLLFSLLLPFLLMIALGGFVPSSGVVLWSLTSPLGALVFAGRRQALGWFLTYLSLVVLGTAGPAGGPNNLPPAVITVFFVLNIGGVSVVAYVLLQAFVDEKACRTSSSTLSSVSSWTSKSLKGGSFRLFGARSPFVC